MGNLPKYMPPVHSAVEGYLVSIEDLVLAICECDIVIILVMVLFLVWELLTLH